MNKALLTVVIVLGLGLAAAICFCITLNQDKNAMADELESTQGVLASTESKLASTEAELTDTNDTLDATRTELDDTKDKLTSTLTELSDTKETLASTESELEDTNQQLTLKLADLDTANAELSTANNEIDSLQGSLADLQDSFSSVQNLLNIAQDTLEGLGITTYISSECRDVELIDNPEADNPTWSELISFLAEDQTEKHEYIANEYDCSEFSRDVHNNAEAAGIRAAEVQVWFRNETSGHALNAFITTDCGLVYVDCTGSPDCIARVKLDKEFRAVDKYSVTGQNVRNDLWWDSLTFYYYMGSSTSGHSIVSNIMIYW
jgi:predicted RNase H-like nuclease (RuvC/YqgF family)